MPKTLLLTEDMVCELDEALKSREELLEAVTQALHAHCDDAGQDHIRCKLFDTAVAVDQASIALSFVVNANVPDL